MNYDIFYTHYTRPPQNSPSEENKNEIIGEAGVLTGHNVCVVKEVGEPQLWQVSRHDTNVGHGVGEFWEGGQRAYQIHIYMVKPSLRRREQQ